jgi:hypothetical protein
MYTESKLSELKKLADYLSDQDTLSAQTINNICDIVFTEEFDCVDKIEKIKNVLTKLKWEKKTKTDGMSIQD